MNIAADLTQRVWFAKAAEIIIFILLVCNFGGLLKGFKPVTEPEKPKYKGPVAETNTQARHKTGNASTLDATLVGLDAANGSTDMALLSAGLPTDMVVGGPDGTLISKAALLAQLNASEAELGTLLNDVNANANGDAQATNARLNLAQLALLNTLDPNLLDASAKQPQFSTIIAKQKKEKHFYVSNYATAARTQVRSPYDAQFLQAGYAQWTKSYGAGATIGYRRGLWGAETGIAYSAKKYTPQKRIVIDGNPVQGYKGSYLREVDLDVASVPVSVNRQIARIGRTNIRAKVGITANVVAQSAYRYKEYAIPSGVPGGNGQPTIYQGDLLNPSGRGVLEGGSLNGNTWVTADIGLRLEHRIGHNLTAFVEPNFSQSIAGKIGPKRDQLNGVMVMAGVMANVL